MSKVIIGLIGEMASGKSTVTEYLKTKHNAVTFRFSTMLRDVLKRLHLEETRGNMQQLSTVLRQNFGEDLLSKVLAADVAESNSTVIITEGIRRPTDITYLKDLPGFVLIALTVSERTRFERLILRAENPDDQKKTWEQFQAEGRQESEQKIAELMREATYTIDNNGSMDELLKQMDKIVTMIKK